MGGSIPPMTTMSKKKKTRVVYSSDIGKPVQGVKFNNRKKDKKK
tara:strand:- start:715 stop:846 length:132 start_codon:yes stop_codon:yes gene_type:complete